ncbi:hypothetical protein GDO81_001629 [Engystomops pustulosus]|uniref:Uncharacterized protein n=1 Tax=Engystomops pustulosus TaxID=76066 RepID=A0AAV7DEC4_ENGPU|nr:hypothetical protein GDO81_001629 [Engystomops pustulosus]
MSCEKPHALPCTQPLILPCLWLACCVWQLTCFPLHNPAPLLIRASDQKEIWSGVTEEPGEESCAEEGMLASLHLSMWSC